MRRTVMLLAIIALVAASMALGGGLASAQPPSGSADTCPPGYEPMTLEALIAQGEREGRTEAEERALFERVNKNEDDWICQEPLPGNPKSGVTYYNFLDNQALGLDKS